MLKSLIGKVDCDHLLILAARIWSSKMLSLIVPVWLPLAALMDELPSFTADRS